jgi:hypothetical protein
MSQYKVKIIVSVRVKESGSTTDHCTTVTPVNGVVVTLCKVGHWKRTVVNKIGVTVALSVFKEPDSFPPVTNDKIFVAIPV